MEYRVTISLGQDDADPAVLDERAASVQRRMPPGAVVVVDPIKAAVQLVVAVHVDDALQAAQQAVDMVADGLSGAGLARPSTIVTIEAEAVAVELTGEDLRPHPVP